MSTVWFWNVLCFVLIWSAVIVVANGVTYGIARIASKLFKKKGEELLPDIETVGMISSIALDFAIVISFTIVMYRFGDPLYMLMLLFMGRTGRTLHAITRRTRKNTD